MLTTWSVSGRSVPIPVNTVQTCRCLQTQGRIETMVSRRVSVSGSIAALALSALALLAGSSPDDARAAGR